MNTKSLHTSILILALVIVAGGIAYGQARRESDPLHGFAFRVEIDGIFSGSVAAVSGIFTESEIIEYREGGDEPHTRKSAGRAHYGNIVLRRGFTNDRTWWDWRKSLIEGGADRKSGSIIILDERRDEVMRWNFYESWPVAYRMAPFEAGGSEKLFEEIEIVVERIDVG
jgi:phage tail-like protein